MVRLRDDLGETVNLGVLDGDRVVYLEIIESPKSMRLAARPGDRDHLHCTALGKAIAAELEPETLLSLLGDEPLQRRTDTTIVERDALQNELSRVAAVGYAIDEEENEVGGRCVAVVLPGLSTAAISLSAPTARLSRSELGEIAETLKQCAASIMADEETLF
jgi:IclR family transcriptional regulator, acetate operon repressor